MWVFCVPQHISPDDHTATTDNTGSLVRLRHFRSVWFIAAIAVVTRPAGVVRKHAGIATRLPGTFFGRPIIIVTRLTGVVRKHASLLWYAKNHAWVRQGAVNAALKLGNRLAALAVLRWEVERKPVLRGAGIVEPGRTRRLDAPPEKRPLAVDLDVNCE